MEILQTTVNPQGQGVQLVDINSTTTMSIEPRKTLILVQYCVLYYKIKGTNELRTLDQQFTPTKAHKKQETEIDLSGNACIFYFGFLCTQKMH